MVGGIGVRASEKRLGGRCSGAEQKALSGAEENWNEGLKPPVGGMPRVAVCPGAGCTMRFALSPSSPGKTWRATCWGCLVGV